MHYSLYPQGKVKYGIAFFSTPASAYKTTIYVGQQGALDFVYISNYI